MRAHLYEPRRSQGFHQPRPLAAAWALQHAFEGLKNRQIGLGSSETLRAAAASDAWFPIGQLRQEVLDQRRLADTRFACHANEQSFARTGRVEQVPKLRALCLMANGERPQCWTSRAEPGP